MVDVLLDPVLSYLSQVLPPPIYSVLISVLSHALALSSLILDFITPYFSRAWDSQTILPPLITLLMAYFALYIFYHTTARMIRTSLWLLKWGSYLSMLVAGLGWLLANGNSVGMYGGLASGLRNLVLEFLNGQKSSGTSRSGSPSQSSRTRRTEKQRPKAWDSFDRHRDWKGQGSQADDDATDANQIISEIIESARNNLKDSSWWSLVKGIVEGGDVVADSDDHSSKKFPAAGSQSNTKAGRSRSR
ncbi:hypothetical protein H0H92_008542 [Tricholoma furcatifolium]|nr:hypothetical protein H0H92_008542 [Tricholoma furcatifolium]